MQTNKLTDKPFAQVAAAIQALDLESVKARLMDPELGEGWTREYADSVAAAYRTYLTMVAKYQDDAEDIMLAKDVDEFWHTHILQTLKYTADCETVFGTYLHHNPHVGPRTAEDMQKREEMAEKTRRLYASEFDNADAAWAGSSPRDAAFSSAAVSARGAAFSSAAIRESGAAFSSAAIKAQQAAFSSAAIDAKRAAFSSVAIDAKQAAFSSAAIDAQQAAFSSAAISAKEAAFSSAAIQPRNAAFSSAAISAKEAAFSSAAISAKEAAFSSAAIKPQNAAFSSAAIRTESAAFSSAALPEARA